MRGAFDSLAGSSRGDAELKKAEAKLVDPVDYIKNRFPDQSIFRYVQTHPDMDHMGGLYRLKQENVSIVNFWDTDNSITKEMELSKWANVNHDVKDWERYQEFHTGNVAGCTLLKLKQGASSQFYKDDGIRIWAPFENTEAKDPDADPNYFSYVLQIQFGKCSIVLGGDLADYMWDQLLENSGGKLPKVDLLKASHHGRKSGYSVDAVKAMAPEVTICSVGELHSRHDAAASYERFSHHGCFSTIEHGTIIARCWSDGDVWLFDEVGTKIATTGSNL